MDAISITVISSAASLMVAMIVAFWHQNVAQNRRFDEQDRRSDERYDALLNQLISVREDVTKIQVDIAELKEGYKEMGKLRLAVVSMQGGIGTIQKDFAELKEGYKEIKELHLAVVSMQKDFVKLEEGYKRIEEVPLVIVSMQKDFVKLEEEYKEIKVVVVDTNARVSRIEGAVLISPKLRNLFEDDLPSSPSSMQGTAVPASPVSTRVP